MAIDWRTEDIPHFPGVGNSRTFFLLVYFFPFFFSVTSRSFDSICVHASRLKSRAVLMTMIDMRTSLRRTYLRLQQFTQLLHAS
jgi:hypothetical protein